MHPHTHTLACSTCAQVCLVLDHVLSHSFDLFFHRHNAVLIACSIYVASKVCTVMA